jgi:Ca2+-binding EF-hand superfamily protein
MNSFRFVSLSLILTSLSLARAETAGTVAEPAAPARLPADRMHSVIVAALDTDRDGVLSAGELAQAPTVLRALDRNEDGVLSADELRHFEAGRGSGGRTGRSGRVSPGFVVAFALDANHDGQIQAMEIANATLSLKSLDANGDGRITAGELRSVALVASAAR